MSCLSPEGFVREGGLDDVLAVIEGSLDTDAVYVGVGDGCHLPLLYLAHPAFWEHDEAVHVLLAAKTVDGRRACEFFIATRTTKRLKMRKRKKKRKKTGKKTKQIGLTKKVRKKRKKKKGNFRIGMSMRFSFTFNLNLREYLRFATLWASRGHSCLPLFATAYTLYTHASSFYL